MSERDIWELNDHIVMIVNTSTRVMENLRAAGRYDHMSRVTNALRVDPDRMPDALRTIRFYPCALFGTLWNDDRYDLLRRLIRSELKDQATRELFTQLTDRPLQAWCAHLDDRDPWAHPFYGPGIGERVQVDGVYGPIFADDPEQADASVGILLDLE